MDHEIKTELGKLKRATLAPDRKATLRAQLVMNAESQRNSTGQHRRGAWRFRGMSVATVSVASVMILAGLGAWQYRSMQGTAASHSTGTTSLGASRGPISGTPGLNGTSALQKSVPVVLESFQMTSATAGWAMSQDGRLLRSLDGGIHWTDETPSKKVLGSKWVQQFYLDVNHAWLIESTQGATPSAIVSRTSNGGKTWMQASIPLHAPSMAIKSVQFVDANHGWVVEGSTNPSNRHVEVYRTTDGGGTWQSVTVADYANANDFMALTQRTAFVDAETGWALLDSPVGGNFTFAKTTDGGVHWRQMVKLDVPVPAAYQGYTGAYDYLPTFFGENGVWPIEYRNLDGGTPGDTYVIVYKTGDGGATWQASSPHRTSEPEPRFYFASPNVGWSMIYPNVYEQTTDGGEHWTQFRSNLPFESLAWNFTDATHGWSKEVDSKLANTSILHSVDGGRMWIPVPTQVYQ